MVERLLDAGADLTALNAKGYTAVHSAAAAGYFEIVLRLVSGGAAWRIKGNDNDVVRLLCKKSSLKWVPHAGVEHVMC